MRNWREKILWSVISLLGAGALGVVAFSRGEPLNALWLVAAAISVYAVAYRFYARFVAVRVLQVDAARPTPAVRYDDGRDFVPTERAVLFGHHFAAIAGAGPLVGPVLAAQMGYLPGTLWILGGVVFAGAMQDLVVLFLSTRRDGRSLGEMVRMEMGPVAGRISLVGTLLIMIIILAVLALVVVKALAASPWGTFAVFATLPIGVAMGLYGRFVRTGRPGQIVELSIGGAILLIGALVGGRFVAENPALAPLFTYRAETLAAVLIVYGFVASVLPVWLVLAPRDYLSTFLKIGAIAGLAAGVLLTHPALRMPALTPFVHGNGPVFAGPLFPFLFITIACGSVSGFHALICSGTTPKLIANECQLRLIGYGGMLAESFVALMALVAASSLEPGLYFAMNSSVAVVGADAARAASVISGWGFPITPELLAARAREVGEVTLLHRAGGAPTLAVGMAEIFARALGHRAWMGFWYHFAILFEAVFILTAVDAGTRVARFILQDLLGGAGARKVSRGWGGNLAGSAVAVAMWGAMLEAGVADPLGGVNTLWPLFGISNQMLAGIALILCTVTLLKMKRGALALVTGLPAAWILACTLTAGYLKVGSADPGVGFLAHAGRYAGAAARGEWLAPATSLAEMRQIVRGDYLDAGLAAFFTLIVLAMLAFGIASAARARVSADPTARELPGPDSPPRRGADASAAEPFRCC